MCSPSVSPEFSAAQPRHLPDDLECEAGCVGELDMLTPPEPDLRHLGEALARARARDHYIRSRRTHAVQLTFPFHTQTTPDV
jgi:hypothetical protein